MCGGAFGHVGGVERQTSMMSRWFAQRGYRVSVVTWDEGQSGQAEVDGVRLIKLWSRDAGWAGVRFLHPRWTSLVRALRCANADLYYHNSAEYVTGQVAAWCRWHRRRFVYSVASDPACDCRLPLMKTLRERIGYRYGLKTADQVIVQTGTQQHMLREGFGRDSVVIPMPCPEPDLEFCATPEGPPQPVRVLWVGRFAPMKRVELLLEVAARLPEIGFDLVGGGSGPDAHSLTEQARAMPNIRVHGIVPRERMPGLYRVAACLCSTSSYEGFPNTFLEAWSFGVPVVSTCDPDGLIKRRGLGATAHDGAGLMTAIRGLLSSALLWRQASES